MFLSQNKKTGFTLIEVIIYTALVSIVLATLMISTQTALQMRGKTRAGLILEEGMRFAITQITDRTREADDISLPAVGAPGNTLNLILTEAAQNPTLVTLTNGVITVKEGASDAIALTGPEIEITNLTFTKLNGTPASVQVSMTGRLKNSVGAYQQNLTLNALAVIRR